MTENAQHWPADREQELELLRMDPELAEMFIGEALDHLGTIESIVLKVEAAPADRALLDDLFRPFHTVKGNAGALGIASIQAVAHKVESLLDLARSGTRILSAADIEVVLRAVDLLSAEIGDLPKRLARKKSKDRRRDAIALMDALDRVLATPPAPPIFAEPSPPSSVEPMAADATGATDDAAAAATLPPDVADRDSGAAALNSVKVDTRKLDGLVDLVGELVIVQSLIAESAGVAAGTNEALTRNLAQLKRIADDLQRTAMSMRMVPVRQTFQKMARVVRDLSKRSGKPIELVLTGEDTELDRRMVEDIHDPLMHMIRNSIDHGIEDAARRQASGKAAVGRVSLSAFHQGGSIVIAVGDDGGGLNAERIVAKALEKNLIAAAEHLSPADVHQLIFRPGFSTADAVTEISGRGVGMDVVRRNIEALRGRIEIQTERGRGTTFLIKLPLTLAIVEGLILRVGRQRFVMPTFSVAESVQPTRERVHTVHGAPRLIQVREALLPLIGLDEALRLDGIARQIGDGVAVVLEHDGRRLAVLVDELVGKQEVVIKSLGTPFAHVHGVAGGAILGDGRVGLILDAGGIIDAVQRQQPAAA